MLCDRDHFMPVLFGLGFAQSQHSIAHVNCDSITRGSAAEIHTDMATTAPCHRRRVQCLEAKMLLTTSGAVAQLSKTRSARACIGKWFSCIFEGFTYLAIVCMEGWIVECSCVWF